MEIIQYARECGRNYTAHKFCADVILKQGSVLMSVRNPNDSVRLFKNIGIDTTYEAIYHRTPMKPMFTYDGKFICYTGGDKKLSGYKFTLTSQPPQDER